MRKDLLRIASGLPYVRLDWEVVFVVMRVVLFKVTGNLKQPSNRQENSQ